MQYRLKQIVVDPHLVIEGAELLLLSGPRRPQVKRTSVGFFLFHEAIVVFLVGSERDS